MIGGWTTVGVNTNGPIQPLEVTYTWSTTNDDITVASATVEFALCRHIPGRAPSKPGPEHPASLGTWGRSYAGCDTLAVVAAGPTNTTSTTTYILQPNSGDPTLLEAAPNALSDVAVLPAQPGLTVDVNTSNGDLLDTLTWERPAECPRQTAWRAPLIAVSAAALVLLAVGVALLTRRHGR